MNIVYTYTSFFLFYMYIISMTASYYSILSLHVHLIYIKKAINIGTYKHNRLLNIIFKKKMSVCGLMIIFRRH